MGRLYEHLMERFETLGFSRLVSRYLEVLFKFGDKFTMDSAIERLVGKLAENIEAEFPFDECNLIHTLRAVGAIRNKYIDFTTGIVDIVRLNNMMSVNDIELENIQELRSKLVMFLQESLSEYTIQEIRGRIYFSQSLTGRLLKVSD